MKKTVWLNEDEAEALRQAAFDQRVSEASLSAIPSRFHPSAGRQPVAQLVSAKHWDSGLPH